MQTKMRYPFIYFLQQPNHVMVYKIQTLEHITLADITEKGEWRQYMLQQHEQFATFNHEQSSPLEGWSIWGPQDQLYQLVDCINDYIQQQSSIRGKL